MTNEYATDTSDSNDTTKDKDEEEKPFKVEITNHPEKEKEKNPTSQDTEDIYDYTLTDEQIKEMTDAQ